jgi:hypothetical protein
VEDNRTVVICSLTQLTETTDSLADVASHHVSQDHSTFSMGKSRRGEEMAAAAAS